MMKRRILIIVLLIANSVFAQPSFELEEIEDLLIQRINDRRVENKVSELKRDEILDASAFEQASYIIKSGKLEHTQDNKKMASLEDRLISFEGFYGLSTQNIAQIGIGVKAQLEKEGGKINVTTPEQMIQAVIFDWMSDDLSRSNIIQKELSRVGVSVISEDEKTYTFVLVSSGEPYIPPKNAKLNTKQYGILPFEKEICDPFLKEYGTTESLFSDVLSIEGNEIVFSFHSESFVNQIISSGGDAFAVDVIERKQFACNQPTNLFPGELQDGYLLSPIGKSKLSALNTEAENECESCRKVKAVFGDLPAGLSKEDVELNLKIIKDDHFCLTVPFNQIETKNTKWYNFPLLASKHDSMNLFTKEDTAIFNSGLGDLENLFNKIEAYSSAFQLDVVDASLKIVVAPSVKVNQNEIKDQLRSILSISDSDSALLHVEIKQNWEAYQQFKEGTYYQIETKGMNKEQEIAYLSEEYLKDEELKTALNDLTEFQITIMSNLNQVNASSIESKKKAMLYCIDSEKIDQAIYLQHQIFNELDSDISSLDLLDDKKQTEITLPLINNQILRQRAVDQRRFDGNPIHLAFLELYFVQKTEAIIAYNYHLSLLEYWSKSNKNIKNIEEWYKGFSRINKNNLKKESVAKAMLNYWIIAGDYYYENQNFDKRKKAFNEVLKWANKAGLNQNEKVEIAKYLCHQDQFELAIQLLKPEVLKDEASTYLMTYFLQAAIYHDELAPLSIYIKVLEKLKLKDQNEFCQLFSSKKMGIQMTKHPQIKSMFCSNCSN